VRAQLVHARLDLTSLLFEEVSHVPSCLSCVHTHSLTCE
jgi:hypothetical protein